MIALALALLLCHPLPCQDPVARRVAALERGVASLPVAPAGVWADRWQDPERWPPELPARYGAAVRAHLQGDLAGALADLQGLLVEHPDFPPALHVLGVVSFRLRRYGDGVEAFTRFLARAPGHVGRTRALGHCLHSLGRHGEARAHYERVLAAAPEDLEARLGLALAHLRRNAVEACLAQLASVLAADPVHAEAAYWRAHVHLHRGDETEEPHSAREILELARAAAGLDPFGPRAAFLVAEAALEAGEAEAAAEARERFDLLHAADQERRALQARLLIDPGDTTALEGLVRVALAVGDREGARTFLERLRSAREDR